jgi:hypothetical protein
MQSGEFLNQPSTRFRTDASIQEGVFITGKRVDGTV